MAVIETDAVATDPQVSADVPAEHPAGSGTAIRVAAVALWGVVGSLLGYGILQTALKAAALFA
ncbi:hypothetical protein N866_07765 [Actinotalea ferrariae CF5-4]|uniref:Uncharacterized protein n=1 Tax=Actinotalea ferrariae CF5-4 TaxID=948458 RepID=A0A021VMZ0_9CELL|nr:hypothetical protein [Actinotalea ferrariae]EYR62531.1 hypothetical protein N866_07765 [Actinotalea ferrariae CF5-4]